jgi:hypothetical protein
MLGARDGSLYIGTDSGLLGWANQRLTRYLDGETIGGIMQDRNVKSGLRITGLAITQIIAPIHFAQLAGQAFVVTVTESAMERSHTPQGLSRRTLRAVFG